jgi:hypothetical protein
MSRKSAPKHPTVPPADPPSPLGVPPPLPTAAPAGEEEIRVRAYQKWLEAGSPEGDGERFWLEAERELKA